MAEAATRMDLMDTNLIRCSAMPSVVSGPALMSQRDPHSTAADHVHSVWCPTWPREAEDWLKRHRNCGWPTINTISKVVQNGCHVVYVQHRDCRNDKAQWRFSFSVAEVILIQSWTKIQQIVYHLLRFFAKKKLIQKNCPKEDEVLCSYHLKTLMLWTCEKKPPEWWDSYSVFTITCELLQKLSEWLKRRQCPNYFIPEANLFYWSSDSSRSAVFDKTLGLTGEVRNSGYLCGWFWKNYILPFMQSNCGVDGSMEETPHVLDFATYKDAILQFRKTQCHDSESLDLLFSLGLINAMRSLCGLGYQRRMPSRQFSSSLLYVRRVDLLRNSLFSLTPIPEKAWTFKYFDIMVINLNAAYGLECGQVSMDSDFFAEYIKGIFIKRKIVRCQYHLFPKAFTAERSQFQYLQAEEFMENFTGSNSPPEFKILSEISKELLRKALQCHDSHWSSIAPAAFAYLAALHFASSDHEIVLDLCSSVMLDQMSNKESETMNAGCLFFIEDVVRIVGFCLLCTHLNPTTSHDDSQKQIYMYLDLRLSPKTFAHYLMLNKGINKQMKSRNSALPFDQLLLLLIRRKACSSIKSDINTARQSNYLTTNAVVERLIANVNRFQIEDDIIEALLRHTLENMSSFYNEINAEYNTVDCYHALYLYKYGHYADALHLCENILQEPQLSSNEVAFAYVLLLPPFDTFFDGNVVSLLGFHTLASYLSPLNEDMRKIELRGDSLMEHWNRRFFYIEYTSKDKSSQCTSMKYHYFLGRHFLAKYLRLRCCIESNRSYSQAFAEFIAQEIYLPFEHIISQFVVQKITQNLVALLHQKTN